MILGFYYHIPVQLSTNNSVAMPAFLGLFIDSLAQKVDKLVLFAHSGGGSNEYFLRSTNVTFVDLGKITSAYSRFYLPSLVLQKAEIAFNELDRLLVRSPSPLAPAFSRYINPAKIVYLIIGSYKEGLKFLALPWYKSWAVKLLNHHMHNSLAQAIKGNKVLVNSHLLYQEYEKDASSIRLINTTTLSPQDFFQREDTCLRSEIKLLFVGRIDPAKGLREAIEATSILRKKSIAVALTIVGWEEGGSKTTDALQKITDNLGMNDYIRFEGRKKAGAELFNYYRTHDIYILPSYHEGFPRTIWEALANSCPVVSTTVGSIPAFLKNEEEVLLIAPKKAEKLAEAIERVITDGGLRRKLIHHGFARVAEVRLDVQADKIIDFVSNE